MQVRQIINIVNEKLAGETLGLSELRGFLNDVIYDINSAMSAKFLSFDGLTEDDLYDCFPDNYITSVVTIGAAYKFYITDEEGIDSAQAYGLMYRNNLFYMVRDYSVRIPDEYKDWDNTGFLKSSVGSLTPETNPINIFSGTDYASESLNPDIRYIQGLKGDKGDKGDPGEVTLEYLKNNYYSISEIDEKLSSFSNSIAGVEHALNKVNTISTDSTDSQYPSAKAVVEYLRDNYYNALKTDSILNDISNNILTRELSTNKTVNLLKEVTHTQYPSAKATIDFVNTKLQDYCLSKAVDYEFSNVRKAIAQIHDHTNKPVLEQITLDKITQWDRCVSEKEDGVNKTTTLDDTSTHTQYASAKAVVDYFKDNAAGRSLETGGEIFNDLATNKAYGEYAHAEGYKSKAGGKGFRITYYYPVSGEVELDAVAGLAVGDLCTIVLNSDYPNCGVISKIEGLKITLSYNSSKPTEAYDSSAHSSNAEKNILRVTAKPDIGTVSIGRYSHVEGWNTRTLGYGSHAECRDTTAAGNYSHVEGRYTTTVGSHTHAEGYMTTAEGKNSHTEGHCTKTTGAMAHAEGNYTIASGDNQHVQGRFNKVDPNYAHIVGNGWDENSRRNAHTLDWYGNAWYAGSVEAQAIILVSPNGNRFKLIVSNGGQLSVIPV